MSKAAGPYRPHCAIQTSASLRLPDPHPQASTLSRDNGAEAVVPFDPIPSARAAPRVVAETVGHPITKRAGDVGWHDWQAQKKVDMQAKTFAGRSMQPGPNSRQLEKVKVGPGSLTARRCQELRALETAQLPGVRRRGDLQMVGRQSVTAAR